MLDVELRAALEDAASWRLHQQKHGTPFAPAASLEAATNMCRMLEDGLTQVTCPALTALLCSHCTALLLLGGVHEAVGLTYASNCMHYLGNRDLTQKLQ